jgi:hypothetical protein
VQQAGCAAAAGGRMRLDCRGARWRRRTGSPSHGDRAPHRCRCLTGVWLLQCAPGSTSALCSPDVSITLCMCRRQACESQSPLVRLGRRCVNVQAALWCGICEGPLRQTQTCGVLISERFARRRAAETRQGLAAAEGSRVVSPGRVAAGKGALPCRERLGFFWCAMWVTSPIHFSSGS